MGNLKRANVAATGDVRGPKHEPEPASSEESDGGWWRVLLLRGLVQGDLQVVEKQVLDHIEAFSAPFTNAMPPWEPQWESIHWWLLKDATPLCVASMYSHPELIKWLLFNGADRSTPCYLKQTALDFVGECCEYSSTGIAPTSQTTSRSLEARSAECRRLLLEAPSLPYPPGENVALSSTFSSEVVLVRSPAVIPITVTRGATSNSNSKPNPGGDPLTRKATPLNTTTLQQRIFKCLVQITWQTPLSNGAIIDKYEVRYRIIVVDEDGEDTTTGGSSGTSGGSGSSSSSESWRLERATHNRRTREQKILLVGLQFDTLYEFTIRSWNAAGKGEWGRSYKLKTRESPELSSSSSAT